MIERNERNNCELFGTCSDPCERNERNTPLGGVTVVRGVEMVPMPPFASGLGSAGGGYAFALCWPQKSRSGIAYISSIRFIALVSSSLIRSASASDQSKKLVLNGFHGFALKRLRKFSTTASLSWWSFRWIRNNWPCEDNSAFNSAISVLRSSISDTSKLPFFELWRLA